MPQHELTADRGDAGRRLDLVLSRHLAGLEAASRTRIQRWIADGRVVVNGAAARRVSRHLAVGDRVTVALPSDVLGQPMTAESSPVALCYEDEHLLVLDKAPGVVCHPTHAHAAGTLINALLWRARDWPAGQRPSLVGRLDKWTSGLVLIAKTARMHARLQRTLASPESVKEYVALVYGHVSPASGRISLRLSRDRVDRRRVAASTTEGAFSLTAYERVSAIDVPDTTVTIVRCRIATGRTHQIRVHLAARDWPVVGDPVYGEPRWRDVIDPELSALLAAFPRQALHASRLVFDHPRTGHRVDVECALPEDMSGLLNGLGLALPRPDGDTVCARSSGGEPANLSEPAEPAP